MSEQIVIDQYSPLSHKPLVGDAGRQPYTRNTAPSWVPEGDRRRLAAYLVRQAYRSNVARMLLPPPARMLTTTTQPDDPRSEHREYGDADLLVDRVVAGVLGNDWELIVEGADEDLPEEPDLPPEPEPLDGDVNPILARVHATRMARWEESATAIVDQWEADWQAQPELQSRQEALREWADAVQFDARIDEAEHDAVTLGDTVIVAWPRDGDWPRLAVYDPGFYFPVIDDDSTEDFPTRVHLAWEFERLEQGQTKRFVRRITFDLVDLTGTRSAPNDLTEQPEWLDADGQPAPHPTLAANEGVDPDGRIWRQHPWDPADHKSYRTCQLTDGIWPLDKVEAAEVDALDEAKGTFTARKVDMGIPFLPLIHIPNYPAGKDHFGRSVLDVVAQILDDIAQTDTDTVNAGRLSAAPVLAVTNAKLEGDMRVKPGTVFNMGEAGRMDVLDMSDSLRAMLELGERLQDRYWVTARVPAKMVGRIPDSDQGSGVRLALEFAPFSQLVGVLRMSRLPKVSLLLGFAQKLAMLQGVIVPGVLPRARIAYGNFLPSNKRENVEMVALAMNSHAMSTQMAVAFLVSGGFPVDDARAEVDRIRQEDTQAAVDVGAATTSNTLAAEWLGMELPDDVPMPPPQITLQQPPPLGGGPTETRQP